MLRKRHYPAIKHGEVNRGNKKKRRQGNEGENPCRLKEGAN